MKRSTEVKNFSCRIPRWMLEKFRYIAQQDCRSISSMTRVIIEDHISAFERENGEIRCDDHKYRGL